MHCWVRCANILWRNFASMFMTDVVFRFLVMSLASGWCRPQNELGSISSTSVFWRSQWRIGIILPQMFGDGHWWTHLGPVISTWRVNFCFDFCNRCRLIQIVLFLVWVLADLAFQEIGPFSAGFQIRGHKHHRIPVPAFHVHLRLCPCYIPLFLSPAKGRWIL